jgi:hypothetical protein
MVIELIIPRKLSTPGLSEKKRALPGLFGKEWEERALCGFAGAAKMAYFTASYPVWMAFT